MRLDSGRAAAMYAAVALVVGFAVSAMPAGAQEAFVVRGMSRGMLGIFTEPVPPRDMSARKQLIVEVVEDSPAERAGIMEGDTLLSLNGLAATRQILSAPFEPGDTVVLRIRRDGQERDYTVVAAERSGEFQVRAGAIPDSVFMRLNGIMDAMRARIDTAAFRGAFEHLAHDSIFFVRPGDSTGVFHFEVHRPFIAREHLDSLFMHLDTTRMHLERLRIHELGDSTFLDLANRARVFSMGDSTFLRPTQIFARGMAAGRMAVAGAELSELNDGLAAYFGATDGVLVLNAHEGTPAARAGLQPGDIILSVGGTAVSSVGELRRALRDENDEDDAPVELRVLRHGEERVVRLGG